MSVIILERYANREIRIGAQSIAVAPKQKGDKTAVLQKSRFAQKVLDLEVSSANVLGGYELGFDRRGAAIAIPYTLEKHNRCKSLLDIISEFQERSLKLKKKGGWGFAPKVTVFGKKARHSLLEGGAIMDKLHGKKVAMVTCTIPGSTKEAFRTVADWSGWIMNRLTQVVRDRTKDVAWFYVWELQGRGALHIHFAIGSSSLREALSLAQEIEFKWFETLLELKDKTDVDVFEKDEWWSWRDSPSYWKSDVQVVHQSCAAYFSKYASKQSRSANTNKRSFCPARWWGSSKSIKQGIKDERKRISIEVCCQDVGVAVAFLREALSSFTPIKSYRYDFDLGTSRSGSILGGGWREISYFGNDEFSSLTGILDSLAEYVMQRWGIYADIPALPTQTSKYNLIIGTQT